MTKESEPQATEQTGHSPVPEAKPRSWFARHKVLTVLGAILVLILIGAVVRGFSSSETAAPETPGAPGASPAEPGQPQDTEPDQTVAGHGIGDAVTGGDFTFTATKIETAGTTLGSEYVNTTAQGEFWRLSIEVENIGSKASYFTVRDLVLEDAQGRSFAADFSAGLYDGDDAITGGAEINPGNVLRGTVIFDLPEAVAPVVLVIDAGWFEDELRISLD